jgi:hypothetical protein
MRHVQLEFLLIHFTAQSAVAASETIASLASLAGGEDVAIEQLLGTLVLLHHGAHPSGKGFDRNAFVAKALKEIPDARIVHGRAPGSCGNFGGDRWMSYGVTFLGCQFALARVLELPPGTAEDFTG